MNQSNKRIAYVALIMSFQSGVANKMQRLAQSALDEKIAIDYFWFTTNYQQENKSLAPLKVETIDASNPFKVRRWQAQKVNELHKKYDKIVLRYPLYDPILDFYLKHKENIITEHHTKELDEMKVTRNKRLFLEKWMGKIWMKRFAGLIAISNEVMQYELDRCGKNLPSAFIPNSIPVKNTITTHQKRAVKTNIIMVANFRPWHGLDVIIEGLNKYKDMAKHYDFHIVGKIPEEGNKQLQKFENVHLYGHLKYDKIFKLYQNADLGLGDFKMSVKNMKENTTLKTREYFLNGIALVSISFDPAFPKDFPYVLYLNEFNIPKILEFAKEIRNHTKKEIIQAAEPYINSKYILQKLYTFCTKL